jgi:hypothetical protein
MRRGHLGEPVNKSVLGATTVVAGTAARPEVEWIFSVLRYI